MFYRPTTTATMRALAAAAAAYNTQVNRTTTNGAENLFFLESILQIDIHWMGENWVNGLPLYDVDYHTRHHHHHHRWLMTANLIWKSICLHVFVCLVYDEQSKPIQINYHLIQCSLRFTAIWNMKEAHSFVYRMCSRYISHRHQHLSRWHKHMAKQFKFRRTKLSRGDKDDKTNMNEDQKRAIVRKREWEVIRECAKCE